MYRSSIPSTFGYDTRNEWHIPTRSYHYFGSELPDDDFFTPALYRRRIIRPQLYSTRQVSETSEVVNNSDRFQVMVDVSHFNPEEILVKAVDDYIVVQAKHEERADQHGLISREFTRKYVIPKDVEPEKLISSLSSEGVLTIEAPKKKVEKVPSNERTVPITRKEVPHPSQQSEQK